MNLFNKIIKKFIFLQMSGWSDGTIKAQREKQEKTTRCARLPVNTSCHPIQVNGVFAEWVETDANDPGVFLYLHGGAYSLGSINTHRELVARLVHATNLRGLLLNYRLAPEHPFPAALEDAVAVYHWLLAQKIAPSRIFIAGDSAGGGLALAMLLALRDAHEPLPAGAFCFSPWTDLAGKGASMRSKAEVDHILNVQSLEEYARLYAGEYDQKFPLISPLYADLSGLPPILIQVGTEEILLDDAVRFSEIAQKAGVDVSLEVWEDMFHVFQMFPFLPETRTALVNISKFVQKIQKKME